MGVVGGVPARSLEHESPGGDILSHLAAAGRTFLQYGLVDPLEPLRNLVALAALVFIYRHGPASDVAGRRGPSSDPGVPFLITCKMPAGNDPFLEFLGTSPFLRPRLF